MTILAGLNTGRIRPEDRFIIDRVSRAVHLRCGTLRNRGWNAAQQWDLVRETAERKRLFYVAATRARDYLVLTPHWRKPNGNTEGFQDLIDDFVPGPTEVPWGQTTGGFTIFDTRQLAPWPKIPHAPRIHPDKLTDTEAAERFLRERAEWKQQLDQTMMHAREGRSVVTASELGREVDSGQMKPARARTKPVSEQHRVDARGTLQTGSTAGGAAFGSLVHRLLELSLGGQTNPADAARTSLSLAAEFGVSESEAGAAATLFQRAWESPTVCRLRSAKQLFLEVPFTYNDGNRLIEGRIDALAEEPAGLVLVDFKTDQVGAGEEPGLAEQYTPQLQAYVAAVQAATGQPVQHAALLFLRTLSEVPVPILPAEATTSHAQGTSSESKKSVQLHLF